MNFVQHLNDIRNDLFRQNRFSGCYVYSRDENDDTFKLGMSEANLYGRVKQAKSCYPYKSEFWIQMFIVCHNRSHVRPLEKKLLIESKHLKKVDVENESTQGTIAEQGNRPAEYRLAGSKSNLNKAINTVLNENEGLWDEIVVFSKNGWVIKKKSTIKILEQKSTTKNALQPTEAISKGDKVYVVYAEDGKAIISKQGVVVKKLKYRFKIHWKKWKGGEWTGNYPFNEVYKNKSEASFAKRYWYTS